MSASSGSSGSVVEELEEWSKQLRALAAGEPDTLVAPEGQLAVENAIAAGIALLANEPLPESSAEYSGRPILAKDLLITTDLVLRALRAHT